VEVPAIPEMEPATATRSTSCAACASTSGGRKRRGAGMEIIARFDARAVEGLQEPPIASTPIRGESDNRYLGGV
jgi:hypothetical protein